MVCQPFPLLCMVYFFFLQATDESFLLNRSVGLSSPRNSQASISEWMLMNDFLVQPISASEALHFSDTKSPVVVVYQAQQRNHDIDNRWKDSIDTTLLFTDDYPGWVFAAIIFLFTSFLFSSRLVLLADCSILLKTRETLSNFR